MKFTKIESEREIPFTERGANRSWFEHQDGHPHEQERQQDSEYNRRRKRRPCRNPATGSCRRRRRRRLRRSFSGAAAARYRDSLYPFRGYVELHLLLECSMKSISAPPFRSDRNHGEIWSFIESLSHSPILLHCFSAIESVGVRVFTVLCLWSWERERERERDAFVVEEKEFKVTGSEFFFFLFLIFCYSEMDQFSRERREREEKILDFFKILMK